MAAPNPNVIITSSRTDIGLLRLVQRQLDNLQSVRLPSPYGKKPARASLKIVGKQIFLGQGSKTAAVATA
jgi:hypothetical protein